MNALTETAKRMNADETIVMAMHNGVVFSMDADGEWVSSNSTNFRQFIDRAIRRGETFTRYVVVESDGTHYDHDIDE